MSEIKALKGQIEELQDEFDRLEEAYVELEGKNADLKQEILDVKKDYPDLYQKYYQYRIQKEIEDLHKTKYSKEFWELMEMIVEDLERRK